MPKSSFTSVYNHIFYWLSKLLLVYIIRSLMDHNFRTFTYVNITIIIGVKYYYKNVLFCRWNFFSTRKKKKNKNKNKTFQSIIFSIHKCPGRIRFKWKYFTTHKYNLTSKTTLAITIDTTVWSVLTINLITIQSNHLQFLYFLSSNLR